MGFSKTFSLTHEQVRDFEQSGSQSGWLLGRLAAAFSWSPRPSHPMLLASNYPALSKAASELWAAPIVDQQGEVLERGLALTSSALLGQTGVTLQLQQTGSTLSASLVGPEGVQAVQPEVEAFEPSEANKPAIGRVYLPESGRSLDLVVPSSRYPGEPVSFEIYSQDASGNAVSGRFEGSYKQTKLASLSAIQVDGSRVELSNSASKEFEVAPAKPKGTADSFQITQEVLTNTSHLFS